MSHNPSNKQLNQDANTTFTTILSQDRKIKRLLVRRKAGELEKSHESRRCLNTPKNSEFGSDFKPAYIKQSGLSSNQEFTLNRTISKQQEKVVKINHIYPRAPLRNLTIDILSEKLNDEPNTNKSIEKKQVCISSFFKETSRSQQQIEEKAKLEEQFLMLKQQLIQLKNVKLSLEGCNQQLMQQIVKLRNELSNSNIQRRKLDSQKKSLMKKISFLEKINFNTETKNLQSMREQYLEKQVEALKNIINANKSHLEEMLHRDFIKISQELYESRKTIALQEIKLLCQETKIKQFKINNTVVEQNSRLRLRQKGLIHQVRELRKQVITLQKLNKELIQESNDISFDLE